MALDPTLYAFILIEPNTGFLRRRVLGAFKLFVLDAFNSKLFVKEYIRKFCFKKEVPKVK
jgi:hypothetical protein